MGTQDVLLATNNGKLNLIVLCHHTSTSAHNTYRKYPFIHAFVVSEWRSIFGIYLLLSLNFHGLEDSWFSWEIAWKYLNSTLVNRDNWYKVLFSEEILRPWAKEQEEKNMLVCFNCLSVRMNLQTISTENKIFFPWVIKCQVYSISFINSYLCVRFCQRLHYQWFPGN